MLPSEFLTDRADAVASPTPVLAWATAAVGGPAFILRLLGFARPPMSAKLPET